MIMVLRFVETTVAKEKNYASKKPRNIWDVNIDNIVISKLINSKYFTDIYVKV